MGTNSHARRYRYAPEFAAIILNWLKNYKRKIINNGKALALEIEKSLQYYKLNEAKIKKISKLKVNVNNIYSYTAIGKKLFV